MTAGRVTLPLLLAVMSFFCGCRSIPVVPSQMTDQAPSEFQMQVQSTHGPLTPREAWAVLAKLKAGAPDGDALARHLAIEQAVAANPLYASNRVRILRDGEQTFPAMFAALHLAKRTIQMEYYIFEDVECAGEHLGELLISKRQQGVSVSVIYDAIGSLDTPRAFLDRLKEAGIQLLEFHPINPLRASTRFSLNDRDHRKMMIIDGELGIIGGVNMSHRYQSAALRVASGRPKSTGAASEHWRDTDLEIYGPAVAELERLFLTHWASQVDSFAGVDQYYPHIDAHGSETVRIIGSAPERSASGYYVTLLSAMESARASIRMTTGYFVPTRQEKKVLETASRRGVDVRLMLPSLSDSGSSLAVQHSAYGELLKAGVKIYEQDSGILHSKTVVVDGVWSAIGSSNVDHRSVLFNDEVDAIILGTETGAAIEQSFEDDLRAAHPIDIQTWRRRSFGERTREVWWGLWQRLL